MAKVNRREFLSMSSGVGASFRKPFFTFQVNQRRYEGIAYDVKTHTVLGPATANLTPRSNRLTGTIRLPRLSIQISSRKTSEKFTTKRNLQEFREVKRQYRAGEYPLLVKVIEYGLGVSGYLTYPRVDRGKLGFILVPQPVIRQRDTLASGLGRERGTGRPIELDENGIPISSVSRSKDDDTTGCNVDEREADETSNENSVGVLGKDSSKGDLTWESRCDDTRIKSEWKYELFFSAEDRPKAEGSPTFNQIPDGAYSRLHVSTAFSNPPENLTHDDGMAWADSVELDVRGAGDTKDSQRVKFENPHPDEDTDDESIYGSHVNAGIDVLDLIPFLELGMTFSAKMGRNGISFDDSHMDAEKYEWLHWEIDLDASTWRDDHTDPGVPLTSNKERIVGVYTDVLNNHSGQECEGIYCRSVFTFGYDSYRRVEDNKEDTCNERDQLVYFKETGKVKDIADVYT